MKLKNGRRSEWKLFETDDRWQKHEHSKKHANCRPFTISLKFHYQNGRSTYYEKECLQKYFRFDSLVMMYINVRSRLHQLGRRFKWLRNSILKCIDNEENKSAK